MPKASDEAVTFETSSGNVFADLGLKNAPEREAKAALMRMINGEIKHLQLTQKQAAELAMFRFHSVETILSEKQCTRFFFIMP